MKKITLRDIGNKAVEPKSVLMTVMGNSPTKAITVDEMRKRVRAMDAIERMDEQGVVTIEDADYQVLLDAVNSFPWSQANKTILGLIDDVVNAETVSLLKIVKDEQNASQVGKQSKDN